MADAAALVKQGAQKTQGSAVQNLTTAPPPDTFAGQKAAKIIDALSSYAGIIDNALPRGVGIKSERLIQIAGTIIAGNEKLQECDPRSIVTAVVQTAIVGLNPLPQLAECFFVPYNMKTRRGNKDVWVKTCQFQIGYKGYINIYHRNPMVKLCRARVVCEGDEFEYRYGLSEDVLHRPRAYPMPDGRNVTHAYAVAEYVNGGKVFAVLTKAEIDSLKDRGKREVADRDSMSWTKDYAAMAMTKALKQLKRFIPTSETTSDVLSVDDAVVDPESLDSRDGRSLIKAPDYEIDLGSIETAEPEPTGDSTADAIEQPNGNAPASDLDYITGSGMFPAIKQPLSTE